MKYSHMLILIFLQYLLLSLLWWFFKNGLQNLKYQFIPSESFNDSTLKSYIKYSTSTFPSLLNTSVTLSKNESSKLRGKNFSKLRLDASKSQLHISKTNELKTFSSNLEINTNLSFTKLLYWEYPHLFNNKKINKNNSEYFHTLPCNNCLYSTEISLWKTVDAIIFNAFHLLRVNITDFFPNDRPQNQTWIYYSVEAPRTKKNTFYENINGIFNLTLTYRLDSDIVRPYGLVKKLQTDEVQRNKKVLQQFNFAYGKKYLIAWFVSNCGDVGGRMSYVKLLQKYVPVDIYGQCGNLKCPNKTFQNCDKMLDQHYKFYLAFENRICKDYVTEKLFRTLKINVIPIVLGGSNYSHFLPSHSYINIKDFKTVKDLAEYLIKLDKNDTEYNEYFKWKIFYSVKTAGFYQKAYCDVCSKLNSNSKIFSVYNDMKNWWLKDSSCKYGKLTKNESFYEVDF